MSRPVHHEVTATEPQAVTELFAQLGVRFSFDPAGPGFSYRETRDGDEHLSVSRLLMGGAFSPGGRPRSSGPSTYTGTATTGRPPMSRGPG